LTIQNGEPPEIVDGPMSRSKWLSWSSRRHSGGGT
jgi:hypothetical protein